MTTIKGNIKVKKPVWVESLEDVYSVTAVGILHKSIFRECPHLRISVRHIGEDKNVIECQQCQGKILSKPRLK